MRDNRNFIIQSQEKRDDLLVISGVAERYNAQLKWEAIHYTTEKNWIIDIPKQSQLKGDIQDAYKLVFEGWTDFRADLQKCLDSVQWESSPTLPFEINI